MTSLDFLQFDPDFSSPRVIAAYDELPLWSAMFGLLLLDEVPLARVRVALDVGCGTGFPLIELAERLGSGTAGDREARGRLREHVDHRATVASVRELLESNGFSVTRVVERTNHLRFATGTALLRHHFIKLGFLDAWKKVVPGRETEMFLRLQQGLDDVAGRSGELSLTIPMAYIEAVAV